VHVRHYELEITREEKTMTIQYQARSLALALLISICLTLSVHAEAPAADTSYYPVGPDLFVVKSAGTNVAVVLCQHSENGITRCSRNWSRIDTGGDKLRFIAADDILYIIREKADRQFIGSCIAASSGINAHCSGWKEIKAGG
jgi:hypothetical protein